MDNKEKEIYKLKDKEISIRGISRELGLSKSLVTRILSERNFLKRYPEKNYIAICKYTNEEFNDFMNKSGVLTSHVKKIKPNIKIESIDRRKSNEIKTGILWHEEFFFIKKNNINEINKDKSRLIINNNKGYSLKCKKTKEIFNDTINRSGSITNHLHSLDIDIPNTYKRREELSNNNIYWHLQFFDLIPVDVKDIIKCKLCSWETFDLTNKSGQLTLHIKKTHNLSISDYLNKYSDQNHLFSFTLDKEKYKKETEKNGNHVFCKICEKPMRTITNTHLKSHDITTFEYKEKFGFTNFSSKTFKEKTSKNLKKASLNIRKSFISKPEMELGEFIGNIGFNIIRSNRRLIGKEIDIIIPEKNICFEFNGVRYHSEIFGGKKRGFHLEKTNLCNEKGYKLIHIMEDEWGLKNEIVKSKIESILGVSQKERIFARKCKIKEISSSEKNSFLEKNHIQGKDMSNVKLGAFYNDRLVSVMTFSKNKSMTSRLDDGSFELKRFASDIETITIGTFSKILKYFIRNYKPLKVYSFLDKRWNPDEKNNVYIKNGFKLKNVTGPDYTYYNNKISRLKRLHKFAFGKSSLEKKYPEVFNKKLTEWEMMQKLGYDRIWDCGKMKFELECE